MVAAVRFYAFNESLAEGHINFQSDTFKISLTNSQPNQSAAVQYSDISASEIAAGNGYSSGGITVTIATSSQALGVYSAVINDISNALQASGGTIGPFRYLVLRDSTTGYLVHYWDLGASYTLNAGDYLALDFLDPYVLRIT